MNPVAALEHPVIQAPIGSAATVELAAAVSNAGGMGSLAMSWTAPEIAVDRVRALRAATDQSFAVNFVLAFPPAALEAVLAAGAPVVMFSWGSSAESIAVARDAGSSVGVQIATTQGALRAIEHGADFLICQGVEAGGHVQSTQSLSKLLPEVVDVAGSTPVVAAGGLVDGGDVARALEHGAAAAMLGTRFVASAESAAHPDYKEAIVDAPDGATALTCCFDGGWPYALHRVLRNRTLERWEAEGCPPPGRRPGERHVTARSTSGREYPRYHIASPSRRHVGDVLDLALYAGTGSGRILEVVPAARVVAEIADELAAAGL